MPGSGFSPASPEYDEEGEDAEDDESSGDIGDRAGAEFEKLGHRVDAGSQKLRQHG